MHRLATMLRHALPTAALLAALISSGGCTVFESSPGALQLESLGRNPVVLKASLATAVFSNGQQPETSFLLTDMPSDALLAGAPVDGQMIHIDLLWEPKPGATPLDPTATNASIRYVVLIGTEVGVYGGAGFVRPQGKLETAKKITVTVRDSSLRLLESTPGFVDRLGSARLRGRFTAVRDDLQARQIRLAVSQRVTNALGRSTMVRGDNCPDADQALIASILTRRYP